MKIIATISDAVHCVHVGGEVERVSFIIEVDDTILPEKVRAYIQAKQPYEAMSLSLLQEPNP